MDTRAVTLASSCVAVKDDDTVRRWNKAEKYYIDMTWPTIIKDYNRCMGGVDNTDFLLLLYRTNIQSRKWTLRVLFHFANVAVTNFWLEYKAECKR